MFRTRKLPDHHSNDPSTVNIGYTNLFLHTSILIVGNNAEIVFVVLFLHTFLLLRHRCWHLQTIRTILSIFGRFSLKRLP